MSSPREYPSTIMPSSTHHHPNPQLHHSSRHLVSLTTTIDRYCRHHFTSITNTADRAINSNLWGYLFFAQKNWVNLVLFITTGYYMLLGHILFTEIAINRSPTHQLWGKYIYTYMHKLKHIMFNYNFLMPPTLYEWICPLTTTQSPSLLHDSFHHYRYLTPSAMAIVGHRTPSPTCLHHIATI